MIDTLINIYKKDTNNKLSSNTYLTMKRNLERIEILFNPRLIQDLEIKDLMDINKVNKMMNEKYKLATKIQTILGIKKVIDYHVLHKKQGALKCLGLWERELRKCVNERNEKIGNNEMTENEKLNWIDYEDLTEKFQQNIEYTLMNEDYTKKFKSFKLSEEFNVRKLFLEARNKLMIGLYILIPPTRIDNYRIMLIRDAKKLKKNSASSLNKKSNYICILANGDYEIVFNKYKTAKLVGKVIKIIDKNSTLGFLISLYLSLRKHYVESKSKHLFCCLTETTKEIASGNFTEELKKASKDIVGKELSVNLFRHIFISHLSKLTLTINKKKEIANFMGQTYNPTQQEQYRKIVKKDDINFF
jgi:hypothetical protein